MSVYIGVKGAKLKYNPFGNVKLMAYTPDEAYLELPEVAPSKEPEWGNSLICSSKQRSLLFHILSCKSDEKTTMIGTAILHFHNFQMKPQKQTLHEITLKSLKGGQAGSLQLTVFYTERKNFLGPMELYDWGMMSTQIDERGRKSVVQNLNSYRASDVKELVFYKGSCKKKNVFSCMDQSVNSQQFQLVQDHYRLK